MNAFSITGNQPIQELTSIYTHKREEIRIRLGEFKRIWRTGTEKEIFAELVFCILTPMARGEMCCVAVENMVRSGVLFTGDSSQITRELIGARFIHKKSAYIIEARERFLHNNPVSLRSTISSTSDGHKAREWLARSVKGIGYKEASHFLRNIGFEQNLAILDRHILKNLKSFGVIKEIPGSLTKSQYLDMEKKMLEFSKAIHISMSYLDFVLWYKETGVILK
ncbi:MAG: N-glycosylase/DNA lyase [Deltaproteobacteria bacterium]|nr:N-glycosylase/DNA lyase [Deltaproteobacteria bacterium]MBW2340092.1 N-glycosylase/DNA lyase [Deltaproteobacteria bacterium]